jgi:hypothetical protein
MHADYEQVKTALTGINIPALCKTSGLDEELFRRLMDSPFVDECVHLIVHGLKSLAS